MRVAIPVFDDRVSPVFDAGRRVVLVDIEGGREIRRTVQIIEEPELGPRARRVAELGADVLICGAISRPLETMLLSAGVEVIPQTCGSLEAVIRAFLSGRLTERAFMMPGSCGRRRRYDGGPPTGANNSHTKTLREEVRDVTRRRNTTADRSWTERQSHVRHGRLRESEAATPQSPNDTRRIDPPGPYGEH